MCTTTAERKVGGNLGRTQTCRSARSRRVRVSLSSQVSIAFRGSHVACAAKAAIQIVTGTRTNVLDGERTCAARTRRNRPRAGAELRAVANINYSAGAVAAVRYDPLVHNSNAVKCGEVLKGGGCKSLKRLAPQVGLEPTTLRLTAGCSAIELLRNIVCVAGTPAPRRAHSLVGARRPTPLARGRARFCAGTPRDGESRS